MWTVWRLLESLVVIAGCEGGFVDVEGKAAETDEERFDGEIATGCDTLLDWTAIPVLLRLACSV